MVACLVVEANEFVRASVASMITSCGLDCDTADSCLNGLISCYDRMPDIIILNWMLPDVNGMEFFDLLRNMPDGDRPHVILCSDMAVMHGCAGYYMESLRDSVVRAAFA